jgi:DNA adenine methylase
MKSHSPLRYPGGKTRSRSLLFNVFCDHFNRGSIVRIISPYFGGGSFEFFLGDELDIDIIANDGFTPLWQFWETCCCEKDLLCTRVNEIRTVMNESIDKGRSNFNSMRDEIMTMPSSYEKAAVYFAINRCSFSGATLSGGFSKQSMENRFTESSIERIRKLNTTKFQIENLDGVQFIEKHWCPNDDSTLMFIDPPYYLGHASKLYGNKGDMHKEFDHVGLYESLKDKNRWILTYNDCDHIRNMYSQFTIIDAKWAYGMNKSKKSSEIIIVSP